MIPLLGFATVSIISTLCIIAGVQYYFTGTITFEKPPKRSHLFEDENGEKDNPFHVDEEEQEESEWKYPVE